MPYWLDHIVRATTAVAVICNKSCVIVATTTTTTDQVIQLIKAIILIDRIFRENFVNGMVLAENKFK